MPNHLARFMRYGLCVVWVHEGGSCLGALKNGTPQCVQAMQLAEDFVKDANVVRAVFARVDNPDPDVLFQLALTASRFLPARRNPRARHGTGPQRAIAGLKRR